MSLSKHLRKRNSAEPKLICISIGSVVTPVLLNYSLQASHHAHLSPAQVTRVCACVRAHVGVGGWVYWMCSHRWMLGLLEKSHVAPAKVFSSTGQREKSASLTNEKENKRERKKARLSRRHRKKLYKKFEDDSPVFSQVSQSFTSPEHSWCSLCIENRSELDASVTGLKKKVVTGDHQRDKDGRCSTHPRLPFHSSFSWIVTVTEKWVLLLYVQAGGGVGPGGKGIPYLLGHSMVRVELIHPVESSSSLRLATLLQSICQVDGESQRRAEKEERRRGARLDQIHTREKERIFLFLSRCWVMCWACSPPC